MTRKLFAGFLLLGAVLSGQNAPTPEVPADEWKPLQFLIGTWGAKTQAGSAGAESSGAYTFRLELRGHILARHSTSAGCNGPVDFDCEHGDLLYVYRQARGTPLKAIYKAIYFDNEGHVIHYDVTAPETNTAVFLSAASQPGPQFRLIYELKDRTTQGRFQLRMPGQTEFKSYLEWSGEKK